MNYLIFICIIIISLRPLGRLAYLHNLRWLYIIVLSALITYFLVPFVMKLANKFKWLDYPNERKIHSTPTSRVGGIAIYIAFIITLVRNLQFHKDILGILIAVSIVFIISLLDDIFSLPSTLRLIVQIIATLVVITFGHRITVIPNGWPFESILEIIITIIWFIGITNAINFLDGIDGLVTGLGIFCSIIFLTISIMTGQKFLIYTIAALLGSCLGFLPFNWHKAKIFLGDSGATMIGFILASISIIGWWGEKNPVLSLSTPVLILSVPIYDMIYITISRIKNGSVRSFKQWVDYVGKDHIHHRLLHLGFSVPASVLIIILVTFCIGLSTIVLRFTNIGDKGAMILLFQAMIIFVIISIIMISGRKKV